MQIGVGAHRSVDVDVVYFHLAADAPAACRAHRALDPDLSRDTTGLCSARIEK